MNIYHFLDKHDIAYERYDHPAVYTVEEAQQLVPPMPGTETKNLLLRDRSGKRHFLVVVGYDKKVDLKGLTEVLGVSKLAFASPERLMRYLGVEPGSVTLLGVVNDMESVVEIILDTAVWQADTLKCHPLVNTSTLAIGRADLEKIFALTNHHFRVIDVPGTAAAD